NQPPAFLAANLIDKDGKFPEMYRPWVIDEPRGSSSLQALRVAYIGVIGKGVAEEMKSKDATLTIAPPEESLPAALEQLQAQKPDLLVLLFHGSRAEGRQLLGKFPQFQVALTLDDSDEPSAMPEKLGDTLLLGVGHKGKYIGLVGVNRPAANGKLELR